MTASSKISINGPVHRIGHEARVSLLDLLREGQKPWRLAAAERALVGLTLGHAKVTGSARFAGEEAGPGTLHAVMVLSSIASGQVKAIEAACSRC
ncbi:MAG: hypothetical protein M3464_00340 [Chloroflexota bacterium]|nr:hypothetical protein [Chloroflexota bacterium]